MKRVILGFVVSFVLIMFFVGAQWQAEIAVLNIMNGWEFTWICCLWDMSNWAAYDLFRGLMDFCLLALFAVAFALGWHIRSLSRKPDGLEVEGVE